MNGTINNNTRFSVAVIGAIVIPLVTAVGAFTVVKTEQSTIREEVSRIRSDYVPRNEIELQLTLINEKLDNLIENGKRI